MLPPDLSKSDIKLLYVFSVVVEAGGFSAAQIAMNATASTISRQVAELEMRLGVTLCRRGRGGFVMTDEGKTVYDAAQRVFAALGAFRATVNETRGILKGRLSIAIVDNWIFNEKAPILKALTRFLTVAPQVKIEFHSLAPDEIERAVRDERIAIGFGVFHRHKPGLVYRTIGQERIGLYCAATHPLASARNAAEEDLLLRSARFARRAYLDENLVAPISRGLASNAVAHQIEGIAMLILTGEFIGYLPDSYADLWIRNGRMAAVAHGRHDRETEIKQVRRREQDGNRVLRTFDRLVAETIASESASRAG